MFRDQTASVTRRASAQSEASTSGSNTGAMTRQPSPEKESVARKYFFDHFVTPSHLAFLEGVTPDEFLLKPIMACGLAGLANRERDPGGREMARRYYVDAIAATNTALRHPRQLKEDNTLISVFLLGMFERLTWESQTSVQSWKHHVQVRILMSSTLGGTKGNIAPHSPAYRSRDGVILALLAGSQTIRDSRQEVLARHHLHPEAWVMWRCIAAYALPKVTGAAQVLRMRGRTQIRTKHGALIFRELRGTIIVNALWCETEVPDHILQWTKALEHDPMQSPGDELAVLSARIAAVRTAFRTGDKPDVELAQLCAKLDEDLLGWSEGTLAAGNVCSFHDVQDLDSPHAWNGTRHEYGIPHAYRYWNLFRSLRILLSRTQEAIWRRSWPTLPDAPPSPEHYKMTRNRMTADICVAAAYAFGNDGKADPPLGSGSSGYLLILPLHMAGTCLLEQLAEPTLSPGGGRMILVDHPLHTDMFSQTSTQLAWVIARLEYIAEKIGIRWAAAVSKFLKGDVKVCYDLGRSRVVKETELDDYLLSEMLDLSSISEDLETEDLSQV